MAAGMKCVQDNSHMFSRCGSPSPLPKPYLPLIPPSKTRKQSYSRFVHDAPWMALSGTKYDTKPPPKSPSVPKGQKRALVGLTNRWRLPENVGFDLLGSSQAIKSLYSPYNTTLVSVKTAECPRTSCNHTSPYQTSSPCKEIGLSGQDRESMTALYQMTRWNMKSRPNTMDSQSQLCNKQRSGLPLQPESSIKTQLQQVRLDKNIPSLNCQEPTPMEMFLYHSQAVTGAQGADVILYALDTVWELHKPYFQKSGLLREMVKEDARRSVMSETNEEDRNIEGKQSSSHSAVDLHAIKSAVGASKCKEDVNSVLQLVRTTSIGKALVLKLRVKDPLVSKQAFAQALGSLYVDHIKVDDTDVVGVLAAATLLDFGQLKKVCVDVMLKTISVSTVCAFHSVATKYKQLAVIDACEHWLELNLIPQLSLQIYLSHLRQDVLEKMLKSSRLFAWNEYSLYKLLSYWMFLHQHPKIRVMPSWSSVVTWFMSLPKTSAFLERAEGQRYTSLLRSLRLISITESIHLDEIHKMNIIPQSWLLHIYSQNYHALQGGGGDVSLLTRFESGAVRVGFILDQNIRCHSDVLSLHGFHFEMKAFHEEDGKYVFYMQRLRPTDPILSFKACERQTFSLRQDREQCYVQKTSAKQKVTRAYVLQVRYSIRVQWEADDTTKVYSSGIQSQTFGFSDKTKKSETVTLYGLSSPVYVTFSIMFPTS